MFIDIYCRLKTIWYKLNYQMNTKQKLLNASPKYLFLFFRRLVHKKNEKLIDSSDAFLPKEKRKLKEKR